MELQLSDTELPQRRRVDAAAKPRNKRRIRPQLLIRSDLDKRTNAARFFDQLVIAVENDLGGRHELSAIERALTEAFAGATVTLNDLNAKLLLGQTIDISQHTATVSAMVRMSPVGSGFSGVPKRSVGAIGGSTKPPPPGDAAVEQTDAPAPAAAAPAVVPDDDGDPA
jgi:hypothetical protein